MIISSLKFQNIYSFKNEAGMNFFAGEREQVSKVSAVFGANASGKSNLVQVFQFLAWIVSDSFSFSMEIFDSFYPFYTSREEPSSFEVEFYIDSVFYKLSFEITSNRILSEVLESRKKKRLSTLYSRKYIEKDNSYKFESNNIDLENNFIEKVRPNASVISTARQYNNPELTKVRDAWSSIFIKSKNPFRFKDDYAVFNASKFYSENDEYFLKTKNFLREADLGLLDIAIDVVERDDIKGRKEIHFWPYGVHKSKNEKFQLPFLMESGGTIHLYEMLSFVFPALDKGSVCLIDEIETNLHPNILPSVIKLFASEETNPKGAQLICTTHMPTLMGELCKNQIFLVEKNEECESEIYRLDEVKGVRNDDNFFKKYLAGAYGGIPDVDM